MMYGVGAILVGTVLTGCCIAGCCWRRKRMSQPVQPITDAGLLLEDGSAKSSARGLALQALTLPTMPRIGWFKWSKDTDPVAVSEDKQIVDESEASASPIKLLAHQDTQDDGQQAQGDNIVTPVRPEPHMV